MFTRPTRPSLFLALSLLIAVAIPTSVRAQSAPASPEVAKATGPRVLAVTWGEQAPAPVIAAAQQSRPNAGKDIAMMVAGGAALVVGAIVGGDAGTVIMIGGGAIGIIGLYNYLK